MAKIHKCSFGQFVKDLQNENLSVWLFGCGEKGQNFVLKYRTTGIVSHIKGFIDNNPNQQGKMLAIESGKFPVISLQQFVNSKTEKDAILITSSYVLEILDQLQQIEELQGYKKIISFEPDKRNYEICHDIIESKQWPNVELVNAGLSDHNMEIGIVSNGDDTTYLTEDECENKITTVGIDEFLGDNGEKV